MDNARVDESGVGERGEGGMEVIFGGSRKGGFQKGRFGGCSLDPPQNGNEGTKNGTTDPQNRNEGT